MSEELYHMIAQGLTAEAIALLEKNSHWLNRNQPSVEVLSDQNLTEAQTILLWAVQCQCWSFVEWLTACTLETPILNPHDILADLNQEKSLGSADTEKLLLNWMLRYFRTYPSRFYFSGFTNYPRISEGEKLFEITLAAVAYMSAQGYVDVLRYFHLAWKQENGNRLFPHYETLLITAYQRAQAKAEALPVILDLSGEDLSDNFVRQLVPLLKNTPVHKLDLSQNALSSRSVYDLTLLVHQNPELTELNLSHNPTLVNGFCSKSSEFLNVLSSSDLITLVLEDNALGDDEVKRIAGMLRVNKHLRTLSLSGNKITDAGARALLKALSRNTTLERLVLEDNKVSAQVRDLILNKLIDNWKKTYASSSSLKRFSFSNLSARFKIPQFPRLGFFRQPPEFLLSDGSDDGLDQEFPDAFLSHPASQSSALGASDRASSSSDNSSIVPSQSTFPEIPLEASLPGIMPQTVCKASSRASSSNDNTVSAPSTGDATRSDEQPENLRLAPVFGMQWQKAAADLQWEIDHLPKIIMGLLIQDVDESVLFEALDAPKPVYSWAMRDFIFEQFIHENVIFNQWLQILKEFGLDLGPRILLAAAIACRRLGVVRAFCLQTRLLLPEKQMYSLLETTVEGCFLANTMRRLDLSPLPGVSSGLQSFIKDFANRIQSLADNKSIQEIVLQENQILEKDLLAMLTALKTNQTLEVLNLSQCFLNTPLRKSRFSSAVMEALSELLEVHPKLHTLDLSHCDLTDDLLKILLTGLKHNRSLHTLNLSQDSHSELTNACMVELSKIISTHPTLKNVLLSGHLYIRTYWHDAISEVLSKKSEVLKESSKNEIRFTESKLETHNALAASKGSILSADTSVGTVDHLENVTALDNPTPEAQPEAPETLFEVATDVYRSYLDQLKKEIQELDQKHAQLASTQSQHSETLKEVQQTGMHTRRELKEKCALLEKMIEASEGLEEKRRKKRERLPQKEWLYYNRVYKQLADFFIACCVVNSGLISRSTKTTAGHLGTGLSQLESPEETAHTIGFGMKLCGEFLNFIPGLGVAVKGIGHAIEFVSRCRENQQMRAVAQLGDLGELQTLAHETASLLTKRYKEQINKLCLPEEEHLGTTQHVVHKIKSAAGLAPKRPLSGLELVAEFGVARMIDGLLSDNTLLDEMFQQNKREVSPQELLSYISTPTPSKMPKPQWFNQALENVYERVGQTTVMTVEGKPWVLDKIYLCPVIQAEDGYLYGHEDITQQEIYGKRLGTLGQVEQWGFHRLLQVISLDNSTPAADATAQNTTANEETEIPLSNNKGKQKVVESPENSKTINIPVISASSNSLASSSSNKIPWGPWIESRVGEKVDSGVEPLKKKVHLLESKVSKLEKENEGLRDKLKTFETRFNDYVRNNPQNGTAPGVQNQPGQTCDQSPPSQNGAQVPNVTATNSNSHQTPHSNNSQDSTNPGRNRFSFTNAQNSDYQRVENTQDGPSASPSKEPKK